ncbi:flagellar basal body P-ring protein FlgI [Euryhalocaulis caribicus]|uniref:flagellar basal body P-ring protein FlgI n=2 Tax=Euryhalocaulis TaxID=1712422 RepID=UPI0003A58B82|nr:flagellar basal body P-ring protein FlgI [Euryhalocaulis caribicus]
MRRFLSLLLIAIIAAAPAHAGSRIKDIAEVEGVRDNLLVGYGLVVGLDGSGDSLRNAPFTRQSLESMLERLGVNTRDAQLNTDNVAAVMVTANLPAFAAQGTRIDVSVSAMGDAESLQGGTLLVTPLLGADGEAYAVSQGSVAIGGFDAGGDAAAVSQGVPTSGRIANGAVVEREVSYDLAGQNITRLSLRNPDFTTAERMAKAINSYLGQGAAKAANPSYVVLQRPAGYRGDMVSLITEIEQLRVTPDVPAKVIVDEVSGVIVMGENVRVSTVAIAQGNLTISVSEAPQVSQPAPFSETGETVVVPRTDVTVEEEGGTNLALVEGVSLQELVDGLNALGVTPRDMIDILQAIKAAGALQAEIEVM